MSLFTENCFLRLRVFDQLLAVAGALWLFDGVFFKGGKGHLASVLLCVRYTHSFVDRDGRTSAGMLELHPAVLDTVGFEGAVNGLLSDSEEQCRRDKDCKPGLAAMSWGGATLRPPE